ncbi:hypothetical protein LVJ94_24725 [Pendulispora rubella]|uniref:Uncharacterized protein n=1 Tax=Pendulispora rubella TaxID=2741070 RepID=A0ABZ2LHJ6_9BACT
MRVLDRKPIPNETSAVVPSRKPGLVRSGPSAAWNSPSVPLLDTTDGGRTGHALAGDLSAVPAHGVPLVQRQANANQPAQAGGNDKRRFVQDAIEFLRSAADYFRAVHGVAGAPGGGAGAARFSDATVRRTLTGWHTTVDTHEKIILDELAGDRTLFQALRTAYTEAVGSLLGGAADVAYRPVNEVFQTYRALVFEWAMPVQNFPGITTPLPPSAQQDPATKIASLREGQIRIEVLPDAVMTQQEVAKTKGAAVTEYKVVRGGIHFRHQNGHVATFSGPGDLVARIQTRYPPTMNRQGPSGYGRGTTAEDIAAGDTSVQFHEGRHGADYLRFFREHPAPQFTGRIGMTVQDFNAAIETYIQAVRTYSDDIKKDTSHRTHCVGVTIDQYHAAQGNPTIECPP